MKPVYSMSEVGGCPRALAAPHLGYEPAPHPEFMELAATEGQRHEEWIGRDLAERGWEVGEAVECEGCGRHGHHVELEFPAFKLVGHMDRLVCRDGQTYLAEFKALSRFRAARLARNLREGCWDGFYPYAVQVSLYHHASGLSVLYCVKNRDTGALDIFLDVPLLPLEEIVDRVLDVEIAVRKGKLPACTYGPNDFEYRFCPFSYLHDDVTPAIRADTAQAVDDRVVQAAEEYPEALDRYEQAKQRLDELKVLLLEGARGRGGRLEIGRVKATLVPQAIQVSYPKAKLEALIPQELLAQCREEKARAEYVRVEVQNA